MQVLARLVHVRPVHYKLNNFSPAFALGNSTFYGGIIEIF
jgi:hypothetical protein